MKQTRKEKRKQRKIKKGIIESIIYEIKTLLIFSLLIIICFIFYTLTIEKDLILCHNVINFFFMAITIFLIIIPIFLLKNKNIIRRFKNVRKTKRK